jgi:hypothetical protein
MANIDDFLEMFNNGDLDVKKYFGDYSVWFNMLKKRGLMDKVDPQDASDSEVWQNEYLLWAYEYDKPVFYHWIQKLLADVEIENGKSYLVVKDRGELADLFCDNRRNDISQDTIKSILEGDFDWDRYWDTTDDVVRDVINDLNPENLGIFMDRIVKELNGKQLSPETELMEDIANEQGHGDYWTLTSDNVRKIVDDDKSIESLLDDELSDMKSDLDSVHSNAYNTAYEVMIYEDIFSELGKYFEGKGEYIERPSTFKKDTKVQLFKIPIKDLEGFLGDYLSENKKYGNSGTIEYHGSYIGLLKEDQDCLSIYAPDYPSYSKIDKYINDYFSDYF